MTLILKYFNFLFPESFGQNYPEVSGLELIKKDCLRI